MWVVDGEWVRGHSLSEEEFTNFGTGFGYSFIPPDEFWIDQEVDEDEYPFYIENMLTQYRYQKAGHGYDQSLELADRREHAMRLKYHGMIGTNHKDPEKAKIVELLEIDEV